MAIVLAADKVSTLNWQRVQQWLGAIREPPSLFAYYIEWRNERIFVLPNFRMADNAEAERPRHRTAGVPSQ